jgi:hypothetical protein
MIAREPSPGDAEDGPVSERLGVLAVDELEDKVQCHRCGGWVRRANGDEIPVADGAGWANRPASRCRRR